MKELKSMNLNTYSNPHLLTVVAKKDNLWSMVGDESVILNETNGIYYGLNPTATFIWDLIQAPKKISEIQNELIQNFDVDLKRSEVALLAILGNFLDKKLIEIVSDDNDLNTIIPLP